MKKEEKNKVKKDKRVIFTRIMACFLIAVMILATCSTCIYYILVNVQ